MLPERHEYVSLMNRQTSRNIKKENKLKLENISSFYDSNSTCPPLIELRFKFNMSATYRAPIQIHHVRHL